MKKFLALLLVLTMLFCMCAFAGCKDDEQPEEPGTEDEGGTPNPGNDDKGNDDDEVLGDQDLPEDTAPDPFDPLSVPKNDPAGTDKKW